MRNAWLAVVVSALPVGMVLGQAEEVTPEIRMLRAENNMLRRRLDSLKKKLAEAEAKIEELENPLEPTTQATTQPAEDAVAMTFSIFDSRAEWWADPAAITLEVSLRSGVAEIYPRQSPQVWLNRHGLFTGRKLQWTIQINQLSRISEAKAGREYYNLLARQKAHRRTADGRKQNGIVKAKAGDLITAIMAVSTDEVPKLVEYHKPDHPGKGKLRVSATVSALRVTRTGRIELMIEGKWEPAPIEKPKPPRR